MSHSTPPAHLIEGSGTGTGTTPKNPPPLRRMEDAMALHSGGAQVATVVHVQSMEEYEEEDK